MQIHTHVHIHAHKLMHTVHTYIYIHTCAHTCTHACADKHVHTQTHTHNQGQNLTTQILGSFQAHALNITSFYVITKVGVLLMWAKGEKNPNKTNQPHVCV